MLYMSKSARLRVVLFPHIRQDRRAGGPAFYMHMDRIRAGGTDPFYLSPRWQRTRKIILVKAKYIDQLRIREGVQTEADTVHHIFPREQYPEYQWERWNMIAVSDRTHKHLHKPDGTLSAAGQKLLDETAEMEGIPTSRTILIIGLPGTGKSTEAKRMLLGGICYDLDALAAALRLRRPHEERHEASRRMANGMLRYFLASARRYSGRVIVIRTAPTIDEASEIDPDEVVICRKNLPAIKNKNGAAIDLEVMETRIKDIEEWAEASGLEVRKVSPPGAD